MLSKFDEERMTLAMKLEKEIRNKESDVIN
jgi:hypothetical protein